MTNRFTFLIASAFVLAALFSWGSARSHAQVEGPRAFLPDATAPGEGLALVQQRAAGGLTTFATVRGRGVRVTAPPAADAAQRATAFVRAEFSSLGLRNGADARVVRQSGKDEVGIEHVRMQQLHQGVPVTAGEIVLHLRGAYVVAANSKVLADPRLDVAPALSPAEARDRAEDLLARLVEPAEAAALRYSVPRLEVFNRGLLQPGSFPTRLAWFVEATGRFVREAVWIDARDGGVLLHFNRVATARSRSIHSADNGAVLPGRLVRAEGGAPSGLADADAAYDFSGDTYDFYWTQFGRDSYDAAGATLRSSILYCPGGGPCPYPNAFWTGEQMVYGQGFSQADDVVAHEMSHAVIEHSANLFYFFQSGALNESFADIFGETIDLTNGHGTDTPATRWVLGEDFPGGAIRNMADPWSYGNPGKPSDPQWQQDFPDDNGGVHTNSGVPNLAYALMVDGGTYNGRTITGIGLSAAARIEYRALTRYLTSGSNFLDDYYALQQACADLTGSFGITAASCVQVKNALEAVEMHLPAAPTVPAPAFCPLGQSPVTAFSDDFESPVNPRWLATPLVGTTIWSLFNGDWVKSGKGSAWGADATTLSDSVLAMTAGVVVPAAGRLQFSHAHSFEIGPLFAGFRNAWDAGVIEYSSDGGSTWLDAGALISAGDRYDPVTVIAAGNPLGGRRGFLGNSFGYTATQLDLSSLAGATVRFRFRVATDSSVGDLGWVVDEVRLYSCASDTPPPTLPAAWSSQDIGAAGLPGSASETGGVFTVSGAGADIWGTADAFRFASQPLSGDGTIVARVAGLAGSDPWAKAGVMIRASTGASSAHALLLVSAGKGVAFQRRKTDGATSISTAGSPSAAPRWLKLARAGNLFTASESADGTTWKVVGSEVIAMPVNVRAGLAVTSHTIAAVATGTFDHVLLSLTVPSLPAGWSSQDIGATGPAGSASASGGVFTIAGSGADVWSTADAFHYASQALTGDGAIVARVASVGGSDPWTKVGVMIRASTAADSPHALVLVSAGKGVAFQRRKTPGAASSSSAGSLSAAPRWLKLARAGNVFTASESPDGTTWTIVGSDTVAMPAAVRIGLAVTSHTTAALATGTFDNVTISPGTSALPAGWTAQDVGSTGPSGSAVESGGVFTLEGGGADIWGTADAFQFASRALSGDGSITARVITVTGAQPWTKAGVMIRAAGTPSSAHALLLVSASKGVAFQRRSADGGTSTSTAGSTSTAPRWLRLVRAGHLLTALESADGTTWTTVGSELIVMPATVRIGLAVSSHNVAALASATFDSVLVAAP